jgi:uncharacterized protein (TIGR00725 family)
MSEGKRPTIAIPQVKRLCKIDKIVFYGSADIKADHPVWRAAYEAAAYVASQKKVVINGGGPGVMNAATQGAKSQNGKTLAITFEPINMPEFEGRDEHNIANQEIKTSNYIERMFSLMDNADLFVCFQGGTGTLSEWATAWLLAHLYYGNHKPLILYGHFWHEVTAIIHKHFFIGDKELKVYKIADNLEEFKTALRLFEEEINKRLK